MKRSLLIGAAASITAAAQAAPPIKAADVLVWSQAERQDRFWRMETLLPHRRVPAGGRIHALPKGRPLALTLERDGAPDSLDAFMARDHTAGLLVLQDGRVRLERYGPTLTPERHWAGFSITKSITSTLYGAAIRSGAIDGIDDPVTRYLPEMKGSAYDAVTIRNLLTMTSGVKWNEDYTDPKSEVARMYGTPPDPGFDPIVSFMRKLPREAAPGTKWNYKTGETDLAGILLMRATGKSLSQLLSETLWRPYGMARDAVWMIDAQGHEPGGCCLSATLEDYGRFGQFVLDGGKIGRRPVLAEGWLEKATTRQVETGRPGVGYGYFWWPGADGGFDARGIFGQMIHVDPKRRLVIVALAAWPVAYDEAHAAERTRLMAAIARAVDAEGERKPH